MSSKSFAIGAVIVLSIVSCITLLAETYMALQAVNPVAILAAVTVALVGIAWLKKTNS